MQRRKARPLTVVWLLLTMLLLSSCRTDWAMWGFGHERQGDNPWETKIGTRNVSRLHQQWAANLDGSYINASPIVARDIPINGGRTDVLYVGTEHGGFFVLNTLGQRLWYRNFGTNFSDCPDTPDKLFGVSASAVFDRTTNRVYVVGGDGFVHALNPSTGATLSGWPIRLTSDPTHEFVYSAPTLYKHNLYIAISARCDIAPYHGRLIRINLQTRASNAFYVTGSPSGPSGGSIWGWGGASVDFRDGNVYIATGNTIVNPQNAVYGEAVVRLTGTLGLVSFHKPGFSLVDDDFGSTPTLFQKSGCPPQLATQQKNGNLFLYDRDNLANGYRQVVKTSTLSINVPAYSPSTNLLYVVNAKAYGTYAAGLLAFRLDSTCRLRLAWQAPATMGLGSTPTIANGVVYYTGGFVNQVRALDAATGAPLWTSGAEITNHAIAAPVLINGQLFISAYDGKLHAYGI